MKAFFLRWYRRYFSDPQAALLVILFAVSVGLISIAGNILAPILASLVIAYLLEDVVQFFERFLPRGSAVVFVFFLFLLILFLIILGLVPLLSGQLSKLVQELPNMIGNTRDYFSHLSNRYPEYITEAQIARLMQVLQEQAASWGQSALKFVFSLIPGVMAVMVYFVIVPFLVFFMLKDKKELLAWTSQYLPGKDSVAAHIWHEVDAETGNFIRAKLLEVFIVTVSTAVIFAAMGVPYAVLLGVMNGLSNLIPYVGAALVTIPVVAIAFLEWGFEPHFWYVVAAYAAIQLIDGNILLPILFSEVMRLHPIAVIVALLVFGGIWGFWGVFFAIPLASLVHATIRAWPKQDDVELVPKES
jgi:putative permease